MYLFQKNFYFLKKLYHLAYLFKYKHSQKGSLSILAISIFIYINVAMTALLSATLLYQKYVFLEYQHLKDHAICLSALSFAPQYYSEIPTLSNKNLTGLWGYPFNTYNQTVFLSKFNGQVTAYIKGDKSSYFLTGIYDISKKKLIHVYQ
jgi:hypothetical protein